MNQLVISKVYLSMIALLILFPVSSAKAVSFAKWLDCDNPSPVLRRVDMFSISKNSHISAQGVKTKLTESLHPEYGKIVLWNVNRISYAPTQPWGAALKMDIPFQAKGKTVGVRVTLYSPEDSSVSFDTYTQVDGPNFYNAYPIGSRKLELKSGLQDILVMFSDYTEDISKVQGVGFSIGFDDLPFEMGLKKMDLILEDDETAKYVEQLAHRTTLDWMAVRGVDIRPLIDTLSYYDLENRIWQATQLIAMNEQINYWHRLAVKYKKQDGQNIKLEKERKEIIALLKKGQDMSDRIDALQKKVDSYVDKWMKSLSVDQRKFYLGDDKRFHYPDGKPFRMYAPHIAKLDSYNPIDDTWIPWDIRNIAAMGFTGIRFVTGWEVLEPEQGKLDKQRVEKMKSLARECEKYGLGLSVDLHFMRPDWFTEGQPGMKNDKNSETLYSNVYHWQEALAKSWGLYAEALKDCPNTVAWEVPCNEPTITAGSKGLTAMPSLQKSWNQWLKNTYKTRENLKNAWGFNKSGDKRFELADDENWDNNTIRWMVVEEKPNVDFNYKYNPRLWDHIRWTAFNQITATDMIMKEIRKWSPKAVGMMHRTIGDYWDANPVPLDYTSIETIRGKHVMPGTHYGMGSLSALRAFTQTYASYDTEQQMQGLWEMVKKHVKLGLGFCPFWYTSGGYSYEPILMDEYGHLRPDTMYLATKSEWIRNYFPEDKIGVKKAAIILNTRLQTVRQEQIGKLPDIIESKGYAVGYFNGLEIVKRPELLKDYDLAITTSSYLDIDLLDTLKNKFNGKVFFYGSLDIDSFCRVAQHGVAQALVKNGIFLKSSEVLNLLQIDESLDLVGKWDFTHLKHSNEDGFQPLNDNADLVWEQIPVPSYWDATGLLAFTAQTNVLGDAWYRKKIFIPEEWKKCDVFLQIGAIDDFDWVFMNGKLIGATDQSVSNAYLVSRNYMIPSETLRYGEENELTIRVRNIAADGGIYNGPVQLIVQPRYELEFTNLKLNDEKIFIPLGINTSLVDKSILQSNAEVLASYKNSESNIEGVAFIRQGRWFWWVSDMHWSGSKYDDIVLNTVLGLLE